MYIFDEFSPEDDAMLQALYSRSSSSVITHVEKVRETKSGEFMKNYYVGYGHQSIGDCGSTTLFFEDVSILAAKAIQDSQLYSGQETSTRYIDFSKRRIHNPIKNEIHPIQEKLMNFYNASLPIVKDYFTLLHPKPEDVKESVWKNTINAKAFDVMRGFLPAGATTQLSFKTNLRQAHERLFDLSFHPLDEVREIASNGLSMLKEKYPNSFSHRIDEPKNIYNERFSIQQYNVDGFNKEKYETFSIKHDFESFDFVGDYYAMLNTRPKYTEIPKIFKTFGDFTVKGTLDYGSFRDLQRHRGGYCPMPVLTTEYGFEQWYIDGLPESIRNDAIELIQWVTNNIDEVGRSVYDVQYFIPMGFKVPVFLKYSLPQMVYVCELRMNKSVHQTLRNFMKPIADNLVSSIPYMKLYVDYDNDYDIEDVNWKRGTQTITEK